MSERYFAGDTLLMPCWINLHGKHTILRQQYNATRTLLRHVAIKCCRNKVRLAHYILILRKDLVPYFFSSTVIPY